MKKVLYPSAALILTAGFASAQSATELAGKFTTAIEGNDTVLWTIGGAIAGFVAVVAVIGLIIRGSKRVASSS